MRRTLTNGRFGIRSTSDGGPSPTIDILAVLDL